MKPRLSLHQSRKLAVIFLAGAASIPSVFAQDAYLQNLYQDVNYLQRGLLEAPLPGMAPDLLRTDGEIDKLTDKFHFSLSGGIRYDSNVYLTDKNAVSDVIFTVSPTLMFRSAESGSALNTFSFTYTPSFSFYSSETGRNTIDQYFSFRYDKQMRKSRLGINLNYTYTSGSDRFVSGTVDRNSVRLGVTYNYLLSGKTSINTSFNTDMDLFDQSDLYSTQTYTARVSVPYQITGKTSIGPTVAYTYSSVDGSPDNNYYDLGLNFTYQSTAKIKVTGNIGYNLATFSGSDSAKNRSTIAWGIAGDYKISEKTSIRGSFYRTPKVSYNFRNSGYVATGIALSASHSLSARTSLYAMMSLEDNDYFNTSRTGGAGNLDNLYYSATLGGRYRFDSGISLGANLTWRSNNADESINDFDGFTAGFNASYNFW